jgi:hypothetical protein
MNVRTVIQPESALVIPEFGPAILVTTRKIRSSTTMYVVNRAVTLFGHIPFESRVCRQLLRRLEAMECPDYRRLRTLPTKEWSRWVGMVAEGTGFTVAALR